MKPKETVASTEPMNEELLLEDRRSLSDPLSEERVRIEDLLVKTSRTFALSIPLLDEPTRWETTIAYLLFRIADTFEDASVAWSDEQQIQALAAFEAVLTSRDAVRAADLAERWVADRPSEHEGYLELLGSFPLVLRAFEDLSPIARDQVAEHTLRTARGMAGYVRRSDSAGVLQLETVSDLRGYCYVVAGIVGEMLTELFLLGSPDLVNVADSLRERARKFGEGLQLVNILRDAASDATEGRTYLPEGVDRSSIFDLAREDLRSAAEYVQAIQGSGGADGTVLFTALPVLLARATLDRVEEQGAGAKLTRLEVFGMYDRLRRAVVAGEPAIV